MDSLSVLNRFEARLSSKPATHIREGFPASETVAKAAILAMYGPMLYGIVLDVVRTGRVTGLFFLIMTSSVVVFTLLRHSPTQVDRSWTARMATLIGTTGTLLFRPSGIPLVPDAYTAVASFAGLLIAAAGLFTLRRSFGLVPANRGVVTGGPYRFVRHPIYAGYLLVHAAFVLAYPTPQNMLIWAVTDSAMLVRILREEHVLVQDPAYARYTQRMRWRVIPFLF
jgi:protein-S-isoprenylcysteine O-methyltransferase Ste14